MKKLILILLLLPRLILSQSDEPSEENSHLMDIEKLIESTHEYRDASGIPGTPTFVTTTYDGTAQNLQGVINSFLANLLNYSPTISNTTVATAMANSGNTTPTNSSTSSSTTTPQTITITTTITTNNPANAAPNSTNTPKPAIANKRPQSVWTNPLIIDANNHDFDNLSVVKFTENIVYKPTPQYVYPSPYTYYQAAIIVAKDNVTIDLSGFNLSLDPSSAANFLTYNPTYGIAVYQGVKNLKIISSINTSASNSIKGSISGFSGYAIYAYGITQSYNTYDIYSNYIKNLTIDNLLITQNINGIYILNGIQPTISNTNVIYNYSPRALFGIYLSNVLNGQIDTCKVNQNFSYSDVCGIYLQNTISFNVIDSEINFNKSLQNGDTTGVLITGNAPKSSLGNEIRNCNTTRNLCAYTATNKSVGINIQNISFYNVITGCRSALCSHSPLFPGATAPITPPTGIGIQINGGKSNQIFNNEATYNDTYGFSDTLLPASASFWSKNTAALNGDGTNNYNVNVPTSTFPFVTPLPTTKIYLDNLDAVTGAGPLLVNIEVLPVSP